MAKKRLGGAGWSIWEIRDNMKPSSPSTPANKELAVSSCVYASRLPQRRTGRTEAPFFSFHRLLSNLLPPARWAVVLVAVVLVSPRLAQAHPYHPVGSAPPSAVPDPHPHGTGMQEISGTLLQQYPYLLDDGVRVRLEALRRELEEVELKLEHTVDEADLTKLKDLHLSLTREIASIFNGLPGVVPAEVRDGKAAATTNGAVKLPGDAGAVLLKIALGQGPDRGWANEYSMGINKKTQPQDLLIDIPVTGPGTTWALVGISDLLVAPTTLFVQLRIADKAETQFPLCIDRPDYGQLRVRIDSTDNGTPTPAMVKLIWKTCNRPYRPSNAVSLKEELLGLGLGGDDRPRNLSGDAGGSFWCVPGPFTMSVPPGDWEIEIRRGMEFIPVKDAFHVSENQRVEKTYAPGRWVDLAKLGWYSGDDHVHFTIMNDNNGDKLLTWMAAEDLRMVNALKVDTADRAYYEQRGFGPEFRMEDAGHFVIPGQEAPRTPELGHTLGLNIQRLVRDPTRYYVYDWAFKSVRAQGGLAGLAHVAHDGFSVRRSMALFLPQSDVDFVEILQFGKLGVALYYDFLNLGFKVAASAGTDVPWGGTIGDERVYVFLGDRPFTPDAWFDALRKGNAFVTNGPALEFSVDGTLPGGEIAVKGDGKLRVQARVWGDSRCFVPTRLEIVQQGKVIQEATSDKTETEELTVDFEVPAGNGFWIAARAYGSDGSAAHSNPVYVTRQPLRFWNYDAVPSLVEKQLGILNEINGIITRAEKHIKDGGPFLSPSNPEEFGKDTLGLLALSEEAPELRQRIQAARKAYEELGKAHAAEAPLRRQHQE